MHDVRDWVCNTVTVEPVNTTLLHKHNTSYPNYSGLLREQQVMRVCNVYLHPLQIWSHSCQHQKRISCTSKNTLTLVLCVNNAFVHILRHKVRGSVSEFNHYISRSVCSRDLKELLGECCRQNNINLLDIY